MLPLRWNRSSNLPAEHSFQTCSIIFALASATSDDVFQPVLVAHAAALLVRSCVTSRTGYQGGMARIGRGEGFVVFVSAVGAGAGGAVMEA